MNAERSLRPGLLGPAHFLSAEDTQSFARSMYTSLHDLETVDAPRVASEDSVEVVVGDAELGQSDDRQIEVEGVCCGRRCCRTVSARPGRAGNKPTGAEGVESGLEKELCVSSASERRV